MEQGIGERFQEETKYARGKLGGGYRLVSLRPEPFKTYAGAPQIKLETPSVSGGPPIWEAIQGRRSVRNFAGESLSAAELSQLLWAAQGMTGQEMGYRLRAAPSAGALYPVETYLFVQNVMGVEPGVYHYAPREHALELLKKGDAKEDLARAALDQDFLAEAAVVFAWTAVFPRSAWKYAARTYRYVYLDAGHIAQNVALAAVALGLGSCQVAALYDDEVNALLGVDGREESILYMTAVGRPRR
jgi:SagB-type dehydrogenase family enzyme